MENKISSSHLILRLVVGFAAVASIIALTALYIQLLQRVNALQERDAELSEFKQQIKALTQVGRFLWSLC